MRKGGKRSYEVNYEINMQVFIGGATILLRALFADRLRNRQKCNSGDNRYDGGILPASELFF